MTIDHRLGQRAQVGRAHGDLSGSFFVFVAEMKEKVNDASESKIVNDNPKEKEVKEDGQSIKEQKGSSGKNRGS